MAIDRQKCNRVQHDKDWVTNGTRRLFIVHEMPRIAPAAHARHPGPIWSVHCSVITDTYDVLIIDLPGWLVGTRYHRIINLSRWVALAKVTLPLALVTTSHAVQCGLAGVIDHNESGKFVAFFLTKKIVSASVSKSDSFLNGCLICNGQLHCDQKLQSVLRSLWHHLSDSVHEVCSAVHTLQFVSLAKVHWRQCYCLPWLHT